MAHASVVINGTRIVFPSNEREVTVRLSNDGTEPGLVQVWLDDGDQNAAPDKIKVPFVLTPPLFRIDPTKGQTVRMMYNGQALPQDRESLFWFNLLEVAPKPADDPDLNYMQMAFRTRIKVFFRPKALNTQEQLDDAHAHLRWTLKRAADGIYSLTLDNPTPYHFSLLKVGLVDAADKPLVETEEAGMAEPGKSVSFALKGLSAAPVGKFKVRYTFLNDYGGAVVKDADLADVAR
jgi:chaperone protein EcpD